MTDMQGVGPEPQRLAEAGSTSGNGRGIGAIVGVLGLVAALTVAAVALDSGTPAGATGLEQFASCEELQAWTDEVNATASGGFATPDVAVLEEAGRGGDDAATAGASAPTSAAAGPEAGAPAPAADASGLATTGDGDSGRSGDTGGTNTVVEGVDEIDVIDRVGDDRLLVSRQGAIALVDLAARSIVAELRGVPYDARISVAGDLIWIAGSSNDGLGAEVRRVRIDGDSLAADGTWTTPGYLLDARRSGDRFHVVVVDQPAFGVVPFAEGPVACTDVWRPVAPATTPAATLVATLPPSGTLAPTAAAEVTGAAGNLLVTDRSVYIATESWSEDGTVTTGVHRFDAESLTPTGSGSVPGTVAGPFALSEHEGNLRVATSAGSGFGIGRPIPVEGDVIIEDVGAPQPAASDDAGAASGVAVAAAPAQEPTVTTVVPDPTETTAPDTTVPEETTVPETTVPETTVPETTVPEETTTVPETTVPEESTTVPEDADNPALAEIFVLDTEGDLDLVGRTGRFGHDYETIHGVRFVGDIAYVVTFLQTDPFWVVDLGDPAAPRVVGELQIPGFSGYLHPIGDDRVVGFGPDGNGSVAARLFDVGNPSAPALVDEIRLGQDTPVAWDHHAFVSLGGTRFAVPATEYPTYEDGDCLVVPLPAPAPLPVDPGIGDGSTATTVVDGSTGSGTSSGSAGSDPAVGGPAVDLPAPDVRECIPTPVGGLTGAVVLEVDGSELIEVERAMIESTELYAERVVLAPDGTWLVLGWDRLVGTDGSEIVLPVSG